VVELEQLFTEADTNGDAKTDFAKTDFAKF
jgi:hypothetical protein